jgi:hypothetical protein
MATANIIIAAGSTLANPPAGEATLFIDTENNNTLSLKMPDGTVKVYTAANLAECCSCEIAKKYMEDIQCALKSGMLNADQFTNLVNIGLTTITTETTDDDGNSTCTVNVGPQAPNVAPTDLDIIPDVTDITDPDTQQYYPQFTPANTTNQGVIWVSSDPSVGTIDQNGLFTTVSAGTTTIYAYSQEDGTVFGSKVITVS